MEMLILLLVALLTGIVGFAIGVDLGRRQGYEEGYTRGVADTNEKFGWTAPYVAGESLRKDRRTTWKAS